MKSKMKVIMLVAILTTIMALTACQQKVVEETKDTRTIIEDIIIEDKTNDDITTENESDKESDKEVASEVEDIKDEVATDDEAKADTKESSDKDEADSKKDDKKDNNKDNNKESNKEDNNSESEKATADKPATESGTPVANHGKLRVDGTKIVDKTGTPYLLQGVSTHGIAWFPAFVNKDAFKTLRDEWGANCVRIAMYTDEYGGYCSGGSQSDLKNLVNNGVSYATDLGMYVIIDWHILHDLDPNVNKSAALDFFKEMSSKYADYDNVIYEICNEPNGGTSWTSIKSYAEEVIPVIKNNDKDAIIIVGTPTWSQDVDQAANSPITGYSNIMYALHFYADTHRDSLRQKLTGALNNGLPVFVSEFGITDASGNGPVNTGEADKWISTLNSYGVGYCIWSLSNKDESSALIKSSCNKTSGWTEAELSDEGKWYLGVLGGKALGTTQGDTVPAPDNNPGDNKPEENKPEENKPDVTAQNGELSVSLVSSGGWNDGTNNFFQYTVKVSSEGGDSHGWKVIVDFGEKVTIDQYWNGNFEVKGNTVEITPVDFNSDIPSGNSVEAGFIVYTASGSLDPKVSVSK